MKNAQMLPDIENQAYQTKNKFIFAALKNYLTDGAD
jgi:hypothetical protein